MAKRNPNVFNKNEEALSYGTRYKKDVHIALVISSVVKSDPKCMFGKLFNKVPEVH